MTFRSTTVCCLILLGLTVGVTEPLHASDESAALDRVTLVVLATKGPVLVDVQISVGGRPYRTWVSEYLVERLDFDQSGTLSADELKRIPAALLATLPTQTSDNILKAVTESDSATDISCEQFADWFRDQLHRSLEVIAEPQPPAQAVRLGSLVDADNNGRVSPEELAAGSHVLRFRDLDDDQTFSASELLPFRDPRNQQAAVTPDAADLPFVQLIDDAAIESAVATIISRYGQEEAIPFSRLRTHPQLMRRFDTDDSRSLNAEELTQFLKEPQFHLTWDVRLSDRSGRSQLDVKASPFARRIVKVGPTKRPSPGRLRVMIDDMPIEIRSRGGSSAVRRDLVGFLGQHFAVQDKDRDNRLSETEFAGMSNSLTQARMSVEFSDADLDSDDHVSRNELTSWIEFETLATQSRVEVSVRQDGKTLFSLLDQNNDRRLVQRELSEGSAVLAEYDTDGDQQLAESELGTEYVLQIGLGQPESLRGLDRMMGMQMNSTDAVLPGVDNLSGPQWFRRMDRNQDGDLSRREFLGTRAQFDQLDADGDSLVDADEAERRTERNDDSSE